MTLQEKIDKLPSSIAYKGLLFKLKIKISHWGVILKYKSFLYHTPYLKLKNTRRIDQYLNYLKMLLTRH